MYHQPYGYEGRSPRHAQRMAPMDSHRRRPRSSPRRDEEDQGSSATMLFGAAAGAAVVGTVATVCVVAAGGADGAKGRDGRDGTNGTNGAPGTPGTPGTNGLHGSSVTGPQGDSYEVGDLQAEFQNMLDEKTENYVSATFTPLRIGDFDNTTGDKDRVLISIGSPQTTLDAHPSSDLAEGIIVLAAGDLNGAPFMMDSWNDDNTNGIIDASETVYFSYMNVGMNDGTQLDNSYVGIEYNDGTEKWEFQHISITRGSTEIAPGSNGVSNFLMQEEIYDAFKSSVHFSFALESKSDEYAQIGGTAKYVDAEDADKILDLGSSYSIEALLQRFNATTYIV